MKRYAAITLTAILLFLLIPWGGGARALPFGDGADGALARPLSAGGIRLAPVDYSVSSYYMSSVYYRNLREVRLTGNQRLDLVNVALSQVGYHEGNSIGDLAGGSANGSMNYTEYGYWFGFEVLDRGSGFFYEWCAMFTAWAARQAQIPTNVINNASYAHVGTNPFFFHMRFYPRGTYIPKPGDLIFYDWAYSAKDWDHVGIVAYVENGRVHTVEGNASDQVIMRDVSLYDNEIQGFGAPSYTNALAAALNVSSYGMPESAIEYGATGDGVRWLQAALLHLGYPCPIDGAFGENTLRQLKRFQQYCGLPATGICASQTKAKINRLLASGPVSTEDPTSYPVPARTLRVGCTGSDVKWLQAALKKLGAVITVDGDFGDGTRAKVIEAQARFGLAQDGVVGPATRERIRSAIGGGSGSSTPSSNPSDYPIPVRTLRVGCSGDDVKWVQAVLTKKGLTMNMTGYFGEKTKNYIMTVQRYYGLVPDGVVGPATLARLIAIRDSGGSGLASGGNQWTGTSAYPVPARNLRVGSTGNDVKWLQSALRKLGYSVSVDGIFGPNTEAKLKAFQRAAGLSPDGNCGPVTRTAIKNRI